MTIKTRFCKVLSQLKEEEMGNFINHFEKRDMEKASRALESIGFINEMTEDMCEVKVK